MKNDKKAMIQTAVLSALLPFMCGASMLYFIGLFQYRSLFMTAAAILTAAAAAGLYWSVVMRERKDDYLLDSARRRIKCSILIQAGISLVVLFLPLCYEIFFAPRTEGHFGGGAAALLIFSFIEPLIVHICGLLFGAFIRSFSR